MKTLPYNDRQDPSEESVSWIDKLAKKTVLRLLSHLRLGRLKVIDGEQVFEFGQSPEQAEIRADITVHHPSVYRMVFSNGSIGSGEAYMQGAWSSSDLLQVVRIMVANTAMLDKMEDEASLFKRLSNKAAHMLSRNSRNQAQKNISAHYDLGNDFFKLFLDETMQYSSAIFLRDDMSLHEASLSKIRHIGQRLQLQPEDSVLEIGCGWGGLAVHLVKEFGCRMTSITISKEQYDYARQWVAAEGLQERIDVQFKDYRDVEGSFDKIISIEMIEAVGHQYYKDYFSQCSRLLKDDGQMLIQAITIADQRYEQAKHNVDFIQKYIFPGGSLPSIEVIASSVAKFTDMQIVALQDITRDYALTLAAWRESFKKREAEVRKLGCDDAFIKMWEFYLYYCEGGFIQRLISTSQLIFAKPGCRNLPRI